MRDIRRPGATIDSAAGRFNARFSDKRVLVVTAGLASKRSFLLEAFNDMCQTDAVCATAFAERRVDRLLHLVGYGRVARNERLVNDAIRGAVTARQYDLICVIKGLSVERHTLEAARQANAMAKIICWTCDDLALPHNQTPTFLGAAPAYDMIFTAKSNNIKYNELVRIGFRRVEFIYQAYSEHDHFPMKSKTSLFRDKVLFIGYAEQERFALMNHLAEHGIVVHVYGTGWERRRYMRRRHENLVLHFRPLLGRDYAEAISNAAINLCFLRKQNRDLHTSRTFEIPACAGFMLAERTAEHLYLFKEGDEAEYFDGRDELLDKTRFFLDHAHEREAIAERGYLRTRQDAYSYHHMVDRIMETALGAGAPNGPFPTADASGR